MAPPLQIPILAFSSQSESWQTFEKGNLDASAEVQSCHASGERELKISCVHLRVPHISLAVR
jgi:hypothetical protein